LKSLARFWTLKKRRGETLAPYVNKKGARIRSYLKNDTLLLFAVGNLDMDTQTTESLLFTLTGYPKEYSLRTSASVSVTTGVNSTAASSALGSKSAVAASPNPSLVSVAALANAPKPALDSAAIANPENPDDASVAGLANAAKPEDDVVVVSAAGLAKLPKPLPANAPKPPKPLAPIGVDDGVAVTAAAVGVGIATAGIVVVTPMALGVSTGRLLPVIAATSGSFSSALLSSMDSALS
jgi:hypothetical protein